MPEVFPIGPCRHCSRVRILYPRGLCHRCYNRTSIRQSYPKTEHPCNRRGVGNGKGHLPPQPTFAQPGSPEKVAVLAARAEMGSCLWHPQDHWEEQDWRWGQDWGEVSWGQE